MGSSHRRGILCGAFRLHTGADVLVECLARHGVADVFGMPGSHCTSIYDAIHRSGKIRTILCRNEQAGAFMADGYARATGRVGVICTTAGPGATNTLTGVAEAYSDSIPILLIAGQVSHDRIHERCGRYHEMDLEGIFRPCTRFCSTVMSNDQIPDMVHRAFTAMCGGRGGSAALFLPHDLMSMPAEVEAKFSAVELFRPVPVTAEIEKAREHLLRSQNPIIIAGGGAVWSDAGREIEAVAERLGCPVVTTLNGKGIVDERSAISLGHGRSRRARLALARADLVLAVGCQFTEVFTSSGNMPLPKTIIQIDIDERCIGMNYPVLVSLVGDARATLQELLPGLPHRDTAWKQTWERARNAPQLKTEWLIETLRAEIPDDTIVFADASEMGLKMHTDFAAYRPRTFLYPSNYASLGWGFSAALGGTIGRPDRTIVSVNGDGGFSMSAQELATAVRYGLKVIIIIHNDSTFGAVKNIQRVRHESRFLDTDLYNPDFVKLGESFGVPSCRVRESVEFSREVRNGLNRGGPSLIEVPDSWRSLRIG